MRRHFTRFGLVFTLINCFMLAIVSADDPPKTGGVKKGAAEGKATDGKAKAAKGTAPQATDAGGLDAETREISSYVIGQQIGEGLRRDGIGIEDISPEKLIAGLIDAVNGKRSKIAPEQVRAAMTTFQQEVTARRETQRRVLSDKNKKEGKAFLDANKTAKGVTTLPSGLQYAVVKQGKGATPKLTDFVKTHYHGTLIDGTVFDSSVERGEPAVFPVGQVIRGWTEALQKMKEGDKWKIFVPSDLAYGPDGLDAQIGPNTVLIFEIELISIEKAPKEKEE